MKNDIQKSIKNLGHKIPTIMFWAEVIAIDEIKETCTVKETRTELEYTKVLLSLNQSGIVNIPKKDSKVLCGIVENNKANVFILEIEKIDKTIIRTESDYTFEIKGDLLLTSSKKIEISNTVTDLKTIITDLLTAIKAITVPTGVGPSGVPINIAQFIAVEQKLNQLML